MQQRDKLIHRLVGIRGVEQTIELRQGRLQTLGDLTPAQPAALNPALRLQRELVGEELGEIHRILVVFEYLLDMHRTLPAGFQHVGEGLAAEFLVHEHLVDTVIRSRTRVRFRIGERIRRPRTGDDRKLVAPIVGCDGTDFHNLPSASSSWISWSTFRSALPCIGCQFSRSHFTTSLDFI
jgi:hypothetical protein